MAYDRKLPVPVKRSIEASRQRLRILTRAVSFPLNDARAVPHQKQNEIVGNRCSNMQLST